MRKPLADFLSVLEGHRNFERLTLQKPRFLCQATLPLHHREPFDRMIAAQALSEDLAVTGNDAAFDACGVPRIWRTTSGFVWLGKVSALHKCTD
ncbi:MAG: hypothetical protein ACOYM3_33735 [Terrimicrobiaceae bacterium]